MRASLIRHNRARCRKCGDVIESRARHNLVQCSCGSLTVDGGQEYLRRQCGSFEGYEELSEIETAAPNHEGTVSA